MDRRVLLVGAVVLVAAAILLVIELRDGDPPGETMDATPTTRVDRSSPRPERERTRDAVQEGTPIVRETVVDGARVRDHRTGEQVPYQPRQRDAGEVHGGRLPAQLVHDIQGKLEVAMAACIPVEARGRKPKIEGSIFVEIVAGQLTVKEAAIELRDVTGDLGVARQCLTDRWIGQSTPAGDTPDTSRYAISVVFAVPPS